MGEFLVLSENEAKQVLDVKTCNDLVEQAFRLQGKGRAGNLASVPHRVTDPSDRAVRRPPPQPPSRCQVQLARATTTRPPTSEVETGSRLAVEAGSSLKEILTTVERIADLSRTNAGSAGETSTAMEQVSASSEEVAASAQSLAKTAQELQQQVSSFKL